MDASQLREIQGMALEVLLGYAEFCFFIRRRFPSAFAQCCAFAQSHHDSLAPVWKLVRIERKCGVVFTMLPMQHNDRRGIDACDVWMRHYRWRRLCVRSGHDDQLEKPGARRSDASSPRKGCGMDEVCFVRDDRREWKHVTIRWLEASLWERVYSGPVHSANPLEMKLIPPSSLPSISCGRRRADWVSDILILGDNLSLAYVLGMGRASDLLLFGVCWKWAAI